MVPDIGTHADSPVMCIVRTLLALLEAPGCLLPVNKLSGMRPRIAWHESLLAECSGQRVKAIERLERVGWCRVSFQTSLYSTTVLWPAWQSRIIFVWDWIIMIYSRSKGKVSFGAVLWAMLLTRFRIGLVWVSYLLYSIVQLKAILTLVFSW